MYAPGEQAQTHLMDKAKQVATREPSCRFLISLLLLTGERVFTGEGLLVREQQGLVSGVEAGRAEGGRRRVHADGLRKTRRYGEGEEEKETRNRLIAIGFQVSFESSRVIGSFGFLRTVFGIGKRFVAVRWEIKTLCTYVNAPNTARNEV